MKLVSISQMQAADAYTINELGTPGRTLMHRAAMALCKEVTPLAAGKDSFSAAVFCGPGNNGGDGWAAASILADRGIDVTVFSGCETALLKGDAAYYSWQAMQKDIRVMQKEVPLNLSEYDVIIDAIFGIGLQREVTGIYKEFILLINNKARHIISADVPSGLYSDEGVPYPYAVKADCTVTFGRAKVSLVSQPGCTFTGSLITDDIGIPDEAYGDDDISFAATDAGFVRERIKKRERISSKGTYGKILLVTGSPGMTGATALCAESCLRSGSGLVYSAVPRSKVFEYDSLVREAISIPVEDGGRDYVSSVGTGDIVKAAEGKSCVIIGPGLSQQSDSHEIFTNLIDKTETTVIADAQTLNDLASHNDSLMDIRENTIFTPHPGEMSRLTGKSIDDIQESRIGTALEFANEHGVIVLLKGHRTIVTDGTRVFINTTGNPGMATAGSGDILCGIIGSCSAVISNLTEAVAAAAFIHGAAGDRASMKYGEYSMKSGDILTEIPWVMKNITGA